MNKNHLLNHFYYIKFPQFYTKEVDADVSSQKHKQISIGF